MKLQLFKLAIYLSAAALLAGCEGAVTVDMSAAAPADRQITSVAVDVAGLEFERSDGSTEKLEFTSSLPTDLIDVLDTDDLRLFTDESLPDGTYTGVRLLFDEDIDATVFHATDGEFPLLYAEGDFADVDFTVAEDDRTNESISLMMDLRRSLTFNDDDDEYTLTPSLRAVRTAEAGQISGTVVATCPFGSSLAEGGAVYLYQGEDIDPDDVGSGGTQPFATTAVSFNFGTQATYSLRLLPPGDYTVALTCNGEIDEPGSDEDVSFVSTANVTVDEDSVTYDFGS
ncbi:hypothetical protein HNQ60_002575 [Povalibacter uvarum]|uniref:DUF4382 domain-containing protein n=1 Tax=Povalibacter uvarum TaxID=732238 RepID=A0A841HM64_9GAMM|nr:DUF4382 domain-containing protein [Povalibacter uvarum]MBB6093694.1 hypothetical protein [Povalibacter uvarum]